MVTDIEAWAIFDYWFEHHGHWMFGVRGKKNAELAWATQGIDGLPKCPGQR